MLPPHFCKRLFQINQLNIYYYYQVKTYSNENLSREYQKTSQYLGGKLWSFSYLKAQFLSSVLVLLDSPLQAGRTHRIIWDYSLFNIISLLLKVKLSIVCKVYMFSTSAIFPLSAPKLSSSNLSEETE